MSIYMPYTYLIGWTDHNKWYYGVRYARKSKCLYDSGCHPDDLWVTYFTSSIYVHDARLTYGEPDVKAIRKTFSSQEDAIYWESRVLIRLGVKEDDRFLNKCDSKSILMDEEVLCKISKTKKKMFCEGKLNATPPNWIGKKRSDKMRRKLSASKMGHKVSDETRAKISDGLRGKKQSTETKKKRAKSIENSDNAYGRKAWLFISPNSELIYVKSNRNKVMRELGLSPGKNFYDHLNTGKSPKRGVNAGWLFYSDLDTISSILGKDGGKMRVKRYE